MFKNESIKAGIQRPFEYGRSKIADKICYCYLKTPDGGLTMTFMLGWEISKRIYPPLKQKILRQAA